MQVSFDPMTINFLDLIFRKKFCFKMIYNDEYWLLNVGKHVFPIRKYRQVHEKLLILGAGKENFLKPWPAEDEDLLLVHTRKYLKRLKLGALSAAELISLELPFSPELVKFVWLMAGGTILTAQTALKEGLAVHIGGGFHHAFPDHGEGFCMLNDAAVAVEKLRKEGAIQKAMIVDCDLHQGNGTALIFSGRKDVFTFSIHQMDIYPAEKPASTVDIGLWGGDGDEEYLAALRFHFPRLYKEFQPDLVFYLAGADPFEKDRLGSLTLTKEGLKERDRIVIEEARKLHLPVAVLFAGGYARDIEDTVSIHINTILVAQAVEKKLMKGRI
jgi:acetoin utilization deacetylase AcuC-like enzyme